MCGNPFAGEVLINGESNVSQSEFSEAFVHDRSSIDLHCDLFNSFIARRFSEWIGFSPVSWNGLNFYRSLCPCAVRLRDCAFNVVRDQLAIAYTLVKR